MIIVTAKPVSGAECDTPTNGPRIESVMYVKGEKNDIKESENGRFSIGKKIPETKTNNIITKDEVCASFAASLNIMEITNAMESAAAVEARTPAIA